MRLRELLEAVSKFDKSAAAAIPGAVSSGVPDNASGPSNYYHKYRVGVAMAASPETGGVSKVGPTSDDMVNVAYTDADKAIVDRAYKAMGYKKKKLTTAGSNEHDVNAASPVARKRKNRFGV